MKELRTCFALAMPGGIINNASSIPNSSPGAADFGHPSKKRCHTPILVLTPSLEGMVVALRAIQAASPEYPNLLCHYFLGFGQKKDFVIVWLRRTGTLSRNSLPRDLIVRFISSNVVLDPV